MFSTAFQGGDAVELLTQRGKDGSKKWKLAGRVEKSFDKAVKGYILALSGGHSTRLELPSSAKFFFYILDVQRHLHLSNSLPIP